MPVIKNIYPGQTLWDVKKAKQGWLSKTKWDVWPVTVKEVNIEEDYILASWNHNPARKMYRRSYSKLRAAPPKD